MFILSVILLVLISCRNDANDLAENIFDKKTESVEKTTGGKDSTEMLKDSTGYHLEGGIRPPIKDGGHWKP